MSAGSDRADEAARPRPDLVLVTVGTDHHPFPRLVRWIDSWLEGRGGAPVDCVVQHGTAPPPRRAEPVEIMRFEAIAELSRRASVVVCHGGPASIADARSAGSKPIVVPRRRRLGEHVDDHQVAFAARLAIEGRVIVATNQGELVAALEHALDDPGWLSIDADELDAVAATVERFARIADALLAR